MTRRASFGVKGLLLLSSVAVAAAGVTFAHYSHPKARATASSSSASAGNGTVQAANGNANSDKSKDDKGVFSISGSVSQLVPGVTAQMAITIGNPNGWPIHVLTIDTAVGSPNTANCPAASLNVAGYSYTSGPGITAPGKGTTTMTLPVRLVDSTTMNQNGCPRATFPLTFSGTAEKAN
jgi:hypothetical protein